MRRHNYLSGIWPHRAGPVACLDAYDQMTLRQDRLSMTTRTSPVLVIGASGKSGSRVADRLRARGVAVRACSRTTTPSFSWQDGTTWPSVLEGVERGYVTFTPDLAMPGSAAIITRLAKLGRELGVRRLVLLSGRNEASAQEAEAALLAVLPQSSIVRASWFFQNFTEGQFARDVAQGEIALPVGPVGEPFIDVDDIADVAVECLLDDKHAGQIYEVTGPELLSFEDLAHIASQIAPKPLVFRQISMETFKGYLEAGGVPDDLRSLLIFLFTEVLDGRSSSLTSGVDDVLGRSPRTFEDFVRRAVADGTWPASA
ncbi:MAG: hypothetical protein ABW063_16250 [Caulobacter sp.]